MLDINEVKYAEKKIQILELKLKLEKSKNDFLMEIIKKLIKK